MLENKRVTGLRELFPPGLWLLLIAALLSACSSGERLPQSSPSAQIAGLKNAPTIPLLPLSNNTRAFLAAGSANSILENRLRVAGYQPRDVQAASDKEEAASEEALLQTVKKMGHRFALSGQINNWRSEDINGARPFVDVGLRLHDLESGKVVWSGNRDETGTIDTTLTAVADKAFGKLVARIPRELLKSDSASISAEPTGTASSTSPTPPLAAALDDAIDGGNAKRLLDKDGFIKVGTQPMKDRSVAIFYGHKPPIDELSLFDRLVLEPDAIEPDELKGLSANGAVPYAYLSIGEVGPHRSYANQIKPEWVLGKNDTWDSKVFDLRNPALAAFLLSRISELVSAGYQGLFLDTMDSYQLYATTPESRAEQETGLVRLIAEIKQKHPQLRLIANRGFEVLERAAPYLEAVAAESLYASWDNNNQEYVDVNAADREWLLGQMTTAKEQYNLDVISIEYLPPSRRKEAQAVAKVVAAHGFIPWVSTPAFDHLGVGLLDPIPRKVIFLFDKRENGPDWEAEVHKLLAVPSEYLGLVPVYHDMSVLGLPPANLQGKYAAVMTLNFSRYQISGYQEWVEKQFEDGVPFITFANPGFEITPKIADLMGVSVLGQFDAEGAKVVERGDIVGYERELVPRVLNFSANLHSKSPDNNVHLSYADSADRQIDAVVTGDWGGYALSPAFADFDVDGVVHWTIDPVKFIESALQIQGVPMPDVTSENGKRLFLAHIDGDAMPSWAEMPGRKLGAEIVHEHILKRFRLPHTISIVEGEMTGFPKYEDRRDRMVKVAREIFAMPNVELATHTYSHPYKWQKVGGHKGSGKYNLPIEGYQFSPEREIQGSVDYIDSHLAPAGKKTEVFLWSGDALPNEEMMAAVYESGLVNLNGGNTVISSAFPSMSQVSPMSRTVGPYVQVYAPIMNENVFTNDWTGPFDGFRRVIETFELTEKPRRLKPINIYYHFYAGTKVAALRSLEDVYSYAEKQDINPVYVSEYSVKVPDFREASVGRYLDGTWKLTGMGNVRSLRVFDDSRFPELSSGGQIVGAKRLHDAVYIHTDGSNTLTFRTGMKKISVPHLVSSNGKVEYWKQQGNSVSFRITARMPVVMELGGDALGTCGVSTRAGVKKGTKSSSNTYLYKFNKQDTGDVTINCQA